VRYPAEWLRPNYGQQASLCCLPRRKDPIQNPSLGQALLAVLLTLSWPQSQRTVTPGLGLPSPSCHSAHVGCPALRLLQRCPCWGLGLQQSWEVGRRAAQPRVEVVATAPSCGLTMIAAPSMSPRSTPPNTAEESAARGPWRSCRNPPVRNPEAMEFHGSSFCRKYTRVQSNDAKQPPQTAKLPPSRGALILTACVPPSSLSPLGSCGGQPRSARLSPPRRPSQKHPPHRQ